MKLVWSSKLNLNTPFSENRIYVTSSDLISENLPNRNAQDHIYVAGATSTCAVDSLSVIKQNLTGEY